MIVLGLLPWLLSPLLIAALIIWTQAQTPPQLRSPEKVRNARNLIFYEAVAGVLLIAATGFILSFETRDARAYALDWTCRQGLDLPDSAPNGACTVTDATLTATLRITRRLNVYHYINVTFPDGRRTRFTAYGHADMDVWHAVHAHPGLGARVQLLYGRLTELRTADGRIATGELPVNIVGQAAKFAALGVGFLIAAFLQAVVPPLILPRGW